MVWVALRGLVDLVSNPCFFFLVLWLARSVVVASPVLYWCWYQCGWLGQGRLDAEAVASGLVGDVCSVVG
jgi:hypothetical protein